MGAKRSLAGLLALALLGSPYASPVQAEEPELERAVADAIRFSIGSEAWLTGSQELTATLEDATVESAARAAIVAAVSSWAENEIKVAKAELTELHRSERAARRELSGPEHECERRVVQRSIEAAMASLRKDISELRTLRGGDRSKLFSRIGRRISRGARQAWRWVGPVPRRILRLAGEEALSIVVSGGTLHGGTARKLLIHAGRKQVPDLVLAAVGRTARQQNAEMMAAAREACVEEARTTPGGDAPAAVGSAVDWPLGGAPAFKGGQWELGICTGSAQFSLEEFMPAPPYSEPYALVHVDWPSKEDVLLTYFATTGDPSAKHPAYEAVMTAGCPEGLEWNNCGPVIPLVFTQADEAMRGQANNRQDDPGTYTLAVEPKGACLYSDENGNWDASREYPAEIEVTAYVEHYRAGESTPWAIEGPFSASVPFWSDEPFLTLQPADYRRVLGTFEWDPNVEITDTSPSDTEAE